MLARFSYVDENGKFVHSPERTHDKTHYATMLQARGSIISTTGGKLAMAATIATRYSCVRTQGFVDTKHTSSYQSPERKIIDYQMQRYRVLKQVALAYAMKFTGQWMLHKFAQAESGGNDVVTATEALPELAATAAGLKAICTFLCCQGIEDCRKCCGGNGYLLNAAAGQVGADFLLFVTAEGDYLVMLLQTARFLIKSMAKASKGQIAVPGPVDYLAGLSDSAFKLDHELKRLLPRVPKTVDDLYDLDVLVGLYKCNALAAVLEAATQLKLEQDAGRSADDAWNACAVVLVEAVNAHCYLFMLKNFIDQIQTVPDGPVKSVLHKVCVLFACSFLNGAIFLNSLCAGFR